MSYCKNCGTKLDYNEKFCPKCGASLDTEEVGSIPQKPASIVNQTESIVHHPINRLCKIRPMAIRQPPSFLLMYRIPFMWLNLKK